MEKREKIALVLSGGGARGAYEAGVWQALTELGIQPDIVAGTSVGSINGAMVCQGDLELTMRLWKELETHMIFDMPEGSQPIDYAKEMVINKGAGSSRLKELLTKYIDENQIRNSPVEYGLVTVELKTLKPHYVFREDIKEGQLIDYIVASSSAFPAIHAHEIDGVEYIDGGYVDVLPIEMALKKGATKIIAVKLKAIGVEKHRDYEKEGIIVVEPQWDLGNVLTFDVNNARKIMRLGYLDCMKKFGIFDGHYYTLAKGSFNKTETKMADSCAKIFDLNPSLIYTKDSLLKDLSSAVKLSSLELDDAKMRFKHIRSKFISPADIIKSAKDAANTQVLCLLIAGNIKEKGRESIFLASATSKLIPDVILGAKFLVKYGII